MEVGKPNPECGPHWTEYKGERAEPQHPSDRGRHGTYRLAASRSCRCDGPDRNPVKTDPSFCSLCQSCHSHKEPVLSPIQARGSGVCLGIFKGLAWERGWEGLVARGFSSLTIMNLTKGCAGHAQELAASHLPACLLTSTVSSQRCRGTSSPA